MGVIVAINVHVLSIYTLELLLISCDLVDFKFVINWVEGTFHLVCFGFSYAQLFHSTSMRRDSVKVDEKFSIFPRAPTVRLVDQFAN